ncbi:phosphate/phosphite/phosphonate ABC transporter substrate-binding protein [Tianweitania sediminis]|uniref:PhnD/SsuA/transferrin family substrate-binding protein n=1 Tax=Tianweitania sediminis TaxID=1502156 RepID=A0A8J7RKG7_9HYPH|nr:PhnD/SsuA/transferrin family substrate-binding protein [Tianweitania sediminis]MBP0437364.1 PhnD/SsuA/transferrin family substrate-binding protein [Tianweitania sediminis]
MDVPQHLVANARMYAVSPAVEAAWEHLFSWVSMRSGIPLQPLRHPAPAPLEELWARPDLGAVFMCGLPFARSTPAPTLVVAPVPRRWNQPVYATDLVVRSGSRFRKLEDTFGGRIGWTVEHSQSGYNALRHHLAPHARGGALYRESVGPLLTPRNAIAAVLEGRVDVAPLDGYFHDLARQNEPGLVRDLRVIDTTDPTPIPPLVTRTALDQGNLEALRQAFLAASGAPELSPFLQILTLQGFARVSPQAYRLLLDREAEATLLDYPAIT